MGIFSMIFALIALLTVSGVSVLLGYLANPLWGALLFFISLRLAWKHMQTEDEIDPDIEMDGLNAFQRPLATR